MRVALYGESAFAYYLVAGDAPSAVAPPASLINPATLRRLPWTMCASECLTLRAPCIAWFLSGALHPR